MSKTIRKPMVAKSPLTNSYYFFRQHRTSEDGKSILAVGRKDDVTESVSHVVERDIIGFLKYAKERYGLELYDPNPVTEEDGSKWTYGVPEKTGHGVMEDFIAEWREGRHDH